MNSDRKTNKDKKKIIFYFVQSRIKDQRSIDLARSTLEVRVLR